MVVGPMQATVEAIAEANNEIAGFGQTRTTAVIVPGQAIWPVESAFDWPAAGKVLARGTVYSYTSRSDTALEGITFTDGETVFVGAAIQIPEEQLITDRSKLRSAMDRLRGAMLVDLAEGSDLGVVGSNIGVDRLPTIPDDDLFREIVKALAYNPRGTIFGIELFLNAALGEGNFEIFEDLIEDPNVIKIKLLGGASTSDEFEGKAFLTGFENQDEVTSTTLNISEVVVLNGTVHGVRFKDEDHTSDFRTAKPSVETIVEFIGDAGTQLWFYDGPSEAADVTVIGTGAEDGAIEIADTSAVAVARYVHPARIQPESFAALNVVQLISSSGTLQATGFFQWSGRILDGAFSVSWGVRSIGITGKYRLGLTSSGTSFVTGIFGGTVVLDEDRYYDIELRKFGQGRVQLLVDGEVVQEALYSVFTTATTDTYVSFGSDSTTVNTQIGRIKQAGYYASTPTDYWGGRGIAGAVSSPRTLVTTPDSIFIGGDANDRKTVVIRGGTTLNAEDGLNNGTFVIESGGVVSGSNLTLSGAAQTGGFVESADDKIFNAVDRIFQFPDDLGKSIEIASGPNAGTHTITELLDPDDSTAFTTTGVPPDLDLTDTSRTPKKTNIARVSAANFITETAIAWRLNPDFVVESGLSWEISDVGSVAGVAPTVITLRQSLPVLATPVGTITRVLSVTFSNVLSAQVLLDVTVQNLLVTAGPPRVYSHYPFYLADTLGFIRAYLDIIRKAGAIVKIEGV